MADLVFPKGAKDDDDDVVIALETARVQFERGDHVEAARWLHRAASAARKQGHPERAGELSRFASKLTPKGLPGTDRFEKRPEDAQVLSDADDDFGDTTMVDNIPAGLAIPSATVAVIERGGGPPPAPQRSQPPRPTATKSANGGTKRGATPVVEHSAVRVAVRSVGDGRFEVRLIGVGEVLAVDEETALLVGLSEKTKFS